MCINATWCRFPYIAMTKKALFSQNILVILGSTASGKSTLAVELARKFKGEIISADSRQVYRDLNIGTAKITPQEMKGVPHHLLNIASPKKTFDVAEYQKQAYRAIEKIHAQGKLPIICGGTGHYIDVLLGSQTIPNIPPNPKLRKKLEQYSTEELFARLKTLDPRRAATIDRHNPRRLIRALEIVVTTGEPVPEKKDTRQITKEKTAMLKIGIRLSPGELKKRIDTRLEKDLKRGLIREVETLHNDGLSWKRFDELGLEYRYVAKFLRGELKTKKELAEKLRTELWRYAKRQITWFKRDKEIHWVNNQREAILSVKLFLKKKER